MKNTTTFENLYIWNESKLVFLGLYKIYTNTKDYFFRDQILRAALSISNNIAEGYERETKKELIRFLFIAKGSAGEVRNMLILAQELDHIEKIQSEKMIIQLNKISAGLMNLIKLHQKNL